MDLLFIYLWTYMYACCFAFDTFIKEMLGAYYCFNRPFGNSRRAAITFCAVPF